MAVRKTNDSSWSRDREFKLSAFAVGLEATVTELRRAGHHVVLVQTIPRWSGEDTWRIGSCTKWDIEANGCIQTMRKSGTELRQAGARAAVSGAAQRSGASVLDTWALLCPTDECSTAGPGYPRFYRDGIHISVPEGRSMASAFRTAIEQASRGDAISLP